MAVPRAVLCCALFCRERRSVFEITIRALGSLVSAHSLIALSRQGSAPYGPPTPTWQGLSWPHSTREGFWSWR